MALELPALPYAYDALGPFMSKETLEFHHDKHHMAYVTNGNNLLKDSPLASLPIEEICRKAFALKSDFSFGPPLLVETYRNFRARSGHAYCTLARIFISLRLISDGSSMPTPYRVSVSWTALYRAIWRVIVPSLLF